MILGLDLYVQSIRRDDAVLFCQKTARRDVFPRKNGENANGEGGESTADRVTTSHLGDTLVGSLCDPYRWDNLIFFPCPEGSRRLDSSLLDAL